MTLDELQAVAKRDRWPEKNLTSGPDHTRWWLKDHMRAMVEVANARGVSIEDIAKELIDELGN
jgi:hypothetical protein